MQQALTYQDICLIPEYSELSSRSLADTSVDLCGWKFKLPIVPANMQDVIDTKIAKFLSENGYFYIYHRFGGTWDFVHQANQENWKLISISTGVNEESLVELYNLKNDDFRVDFVNIDIAHAHHCKVKNRIKWIKENFPNTKIIAGNVATYEACCDLDSWGADIIKTGIGQGSICTTRYQTGFSIPMFSCIENIINSYHKHFMKPIIKPIIADGGVQHIGDIPKALTAGATMIMSGKLFASCIDSPAEIIGYHKQYRGSTSFAIKKEKKHIEGKIIDLEADVTVEQRLEEIKQALQSAISYAGGNTLNAFQGIKYCIVNNN